jgi:ribosomal protein S18 acetylase RimI-like enzyme
MRKIEGLDPSHDREGFDCGSEPLNLFLRQTARQHAVRGISRTFVLVEETSPTPRSILGFFSLNVCQVKCEILPADLAKKLPQNIPAIKIGRLAVAKQFQRQGIGKYLLIAALKKFLEVFNTVGGIGLFVDAKDMAAKGYYEQFGFVPLPSNELELFLPLKTIQEALDPLPK